MPKISLRKELKKVFGEDLTDEQLIYIATRPPVAITIVATPAGDIVLNWVGKLTKELALEMLHQATTAVSLAGVNQEVKQ